MGASNKNTSRSLNRQPLTARFRVGRVGLALVLGTFAGGAAAGCGSSDGGTKSSGGTSAGGDAGSGGSIAVTGGTGGSSASGGSSTGGSSTGGTNSGGSSTGGTNSGGFANAPIGGTGTDFPSGACENGLDDDGDGLVDGLDPECVSPLDNDESSFATGIPGDNQDPKWQDCFFDGNSGGGEDGCRYPTECLYGDKDAADEDCSLAQQCIDYCRQLTPNGCDCFGCCTVQTADGDTVDIYTSATCSLGTVDDEEACPRCQKSVDCNNPCGECELCPGKTVEDLPASCGESGGEGGQGGGPDPGTDGGTPPPPTYTCDDGQQVCGPGLAACPAGLYCSLGCCMVVVR
jgi:hypothetical protein